MIKKLIKMMINKFQSHFIISLLMVTKQIQDYTIYMNRVLGRGTYGSVYEGKRDKTNEKVAVKILCKVDSDEYMKAALGNQISIHKMLVSQNIVRLEDVMESNKNYYIIQELCDGDLSTVIRMGQRMPQSEAVGLLQQICNGFLLLVREGVIHRDLKPANIMRKGRVLKIGDFGFAKHIHSVKMLKTAVGTPLYMSPQILLGKEYTSKCDVWALGFIFYELLHGKTPWSAGTEVQLVKNIQRMPLRILRDDLSAPTQDFLVRILQVDEKLRMSWDDIFRHSIFNGFFVSKENTEILFQNKLKMIMNKLRFYIATHNLDLNKVLHAMGYTTLKSEISFEKFQEFLRCVYENISYQQAKYIFSNTDIDKNGAISVDEVRQLMSRHSIAFQSQYQILPHFDPSQEETFARMPTETAHKISECFKKLYRIIRKGKTTLFYIFSKFDHNKNRPQQPHCLTLKDFSKLVRQLYERVDQRLVITNEELEAAFNFIDEDHSKTIEYSELHGYYCKINGIRDKSPISSPLEPVRDRHFQNPKLRSQYRENLARTPPSTRTARTEKVSSNANFKSKDRLRQMPSKIKSNDGQFQDQRPVEKIEMRKKKQDKQQKKQRPEKEQKVMEEKKKKVQTRRSPQNEKSPCSPRIQKMQTWESLNHQKLNGLRHEEFRQDVKTFPRSQELIQDKYFSSNTALNKPEKWNQSIVPSSEAPSKTQIVSPKNGLNILKLLREKLNS